MDVSILIVNYRSQNKALACLRSIHDADLAGISYEVILVDNDEQPVSAALFREEFPETIVLSGQGNVGMGSGNNIGAERASGEFLLVLNPDTIVRPDAIRILLSFLREHEDVGIVGPRLINPNGTLQYSCLRFPRPCTPVFRRTFLGRFAKEHLARYLMTDFDHEHIHNVDWMIGSCLMIRSNFFRQSSGFDRGFFMYFEDTDLCRRAWRAGYRVVYHPGAVVVHDHGRGSASGLWFLAPFSNRLAREHIFSWIRYTLKWRFR